MIKRVGIDLDNTVADFIKGATPLVSELFGLKPDFKKKAYSIEEVFGFAAGDRPPEFRQKLYLEKRLFRHLPKMEEDNHQLPVDLLDAGFDRIYFITARNNHPIIREDTAYWVNENMSHHDDIFHVDAKADFCKLAGIAVMIEDELRHVGPLLRAGVHVILMDQPWNRDTSTTLPADDFTGKLVRVHGWREAVDATKEFYHEF